MSCRGRGQCCVDRVGHDSWVSERVAGSLGVRVPCVSVATRLLCSPLRPHSGGGVSDDSGGHTGGCIVTKLVARQWVQKGNACRGRLLRAAAKCYRNRCIMVRLMSVRHGFRYDVGRVVFTTVLAGAGLVWPGVGYRGLGQIIR